MTSPQLLALILGAIALQLLLFGGVALWRRRREDEGAGEGAAWEGFRPFRVIRTEAADRGGQVRSFYLAPEGGGPLPTFRPGQYLTFRLELPGASAPVVRCYSLSEAPGADHYRISVKRIGLASGHLHDRIREGSILQVRAPGGHFFLDENAPHPLVLVAGGIGITPMLAIVEATLQRLPGREVWLFYGVRDSGELVMGDYLKGLAAAHPNFHLRRCFSRPAEGEVEGSDYDHRGRVDMELLRRNLSPRPHAFYVCGPKAMMESIIALGPQT